MKFLVLFLATVALTSASYVGRKNVDVQEDGTIVIKGENGKQILISKQYGPQGQRDIEIEVTGPNAITKKIQINDNNQVKIEKVVEYQTPQTYQHDIQTFGEERYKRSYPFEGQTDVFDEIFREYQGVVDTQTYHQLLNKVEKAVLDGRITKSALYFLQALNEDSKWNTLVSGQTFEHGINQLASDKYNFFHKLGLGQFWQQKYGKGQQEIFEQDIFGQDVEQLVKHILVHIFDRQVLINILSQQGFFQQGTHEQILNEKIVDQILYHHGVFDFKALVQLIKNQSWRQILVEQGIFHRTVLEQLLTYVNTYGTYDNALLEQLVNKQVLKYWLAKEGIFSYILSQFVDQKYFGNTYYKGEVYGQDVEDIKGEQTKLAQLLNKQFWQQKYGKGIYGNQVYNGQQEIFGQNIVGQDVEQLVKHILVHIFDRQVLINILSQQGFFQHGTHEQILNEKIVDQILYHHGVFDWKVLVQLIKNQSWRQVLVEQGIFHRTVLEQLLTYVNTYGTYDEVLLEQLVNKQVLKYWLAKEGIFSYILRQTVGEKYFGNTYYKGEVYGQDVEDIKGEQTKLAQLLNKQFWQQKYGKGIYGNQVYNGQQEIFGQSIVGQDVEQLVKHILVHIFDRQVLINILSQQGFFQQGTHEQILNEKIVDQILYHHGVFDFKALVQLIKNQSWRQVLVEQGIFHKTVLAQLLTYVNTYGTYDNALLEQLVNKQVLKYWLAKEGIFSYIFRQIVDQKYFDNTYYKGEVYGQELLVQLLRNPVLRNILVQQGIFRKDILEQISYVFKTQGIYSQLLLDQLINKNVLRVFLVREGIVDESKLERFVSNEIMGLSYLLKVKYSQQTPKLSYKQLVGVVSNVPELVLDTYQYLPYGEDFVGIDIHKTIVKPVHQGFSTVGDFFGNQRSQYTKSDLLNSWLYGNIRKSDKVNYLKNVIYGQQGEQGQRFNTGYTQGYLNTFRGHQGAYNQFPTVQQYTL